MDYMVKLYKDWRLHSQFHLIVADMEDECFFNTEKQSIRESARSLKKYGSTCNHVRNTDYHIRHELDKTDTLQGIALKYSCTTEQIRRANRLFAQDSLFLRQFLMIPVEKDSPFYPRDDRPQSLPANATLYDNSQPSSGLTSPISCSSSGVVRSGGGGNSLTTTGTSTMSNTLKSMDSVVMLSPEEENKKDIDAFLGKIDSTLAQTKKYVAKSQNSFDFINSPTSDNDLFTTNNHHHHYHQSKQQQPANRRQTNMSTSSSSSSSTSTSNTGGSCHNRNNSSGSSNNNSNNITNSNTMNSSNSTGGNGGICNNNENMSSSQQSLTQGRRVQNSLQRLEKQQDEFFEL